MLAIPDGAPSEPHRRRSIVADQQESTGYRRQPSAVRLHECHRDARNQENESRDRTEQDDARSERDVVILEPPDAAHYTRTKEQPARSRVITQSIVVSRIANRIPRFVRQRHEFRMLIAAP